MCLTCRWWVVGSLLQHLAAGFPCSTLVVGVFSGVSETVTSHWICRPEPFLPTIAGYGRVLLGATAANMVVSFPSTTASNNTVGHILPSSCMAPLALTGVQCVYWSGSKSSAIKHISAALSMHHVCSLVPIFPCLYTGGFFPCPSTSAHTDTGSVHTLCSYGTVL